MPGADVNSMAGKAEFSRTRLSRQTRGRSRRGARAVAAASCLLLGMFGGPPRAMADGEYVAMPFTCRFERGRLDLEHSSNRIYRLVGSRDQRSVSVCAERRDGQCRSIEIHRFVFECDGTPVSWLEAADVSAHEQPWRSRIVNGRMMLHFAPGKSARARRPPLKLPAGFGPAPPNGLRFVPAGAANAFAIGAGATPVTRISTRPRFAANSNGGVREPALMPAPARLPEPRTPAILRPAQMGVGWTATVAGANDAAPQDRWDTLLPNGASQTLLAVAGLAAVLLSAAAVVARQRRPAHPAPGTDVEGIAIGATATLDAGGDAAPPPPPPPRTMRIAESVELSARLTSSRAQPPPVPSAPRDDWDSVVELGTTAGALLEIVQQIISDHIPDGPLREVLAGDLMVTAARLNGPELSLALEDGRLDLVHPVYAQAIHDLERIRTLARIEHERAHSIVDVHAGPPATFEQACEFLGVNPRAGEAVVKKVVDALRQNWHPDLAEDSSDRASREERIKRINAAWDLIRTR